MLYYGHAVLRREQVRRVRAARTTNSPDRE
jgi:hypothetical protein